MNTEKIFYEIYRSPLGDIVLVGSENGLMRLKINTHAGKRGYLKIEPSWIENSAIFEDVKKQLDQYFAGSRKQFSVKLNIDGTGFQKKVWQSLLSIPFGQTRSYKEVAELIALPTAARAVGGAIGKNRVEIIIPCHRVIGTSGDLVGFACGVETKRRLLALENAKFLP